jgi:hypothetical protein
MLLVENNKRLDEYLLYILCQLKLYNTEKALDMHRKIVADIYSLYNNASDRMQCQILAIEIARCYVSEWQNIPKDKQYWLVSEILIIIENEHATNELIDRAQAQIDARDPRKRLNRSDN